MASGRSGARNGTPRSSAATTATSSSRLVLASTARVVPSAGQDAIARRTRTTSSAASGARTRRPPSFEPGKDPLCEPLAVVLDEPHGAGHDRRRAPVVGLEIHPAQARQRGGQPEDPPHVGESPRVHRLVVVADQEDVVRGRGQQQGQLQLGAVQVLCLVHEQPRRAGAPAHEQPGIPVQALEGAHQQVVEVATTRLPDGALVGDERPGDRPGRRVPGHLVRGDPQVQLEPREREVQPPAVRPRDARETGRAAPRPGPPAAPRRRPRRGGSRGRGRGTSGPSRNRRQRQAAASAASSRVGQLLCRALVERDDADRPGVRPAVHEPRHPRDQRRGLARTRGCDAQHGTRRCGRGRALVGCEPGEALGDGRVHRQSLAITAYAGLNRPPGCWCTRRRAWSLARAASAQG